MEHLLASCFLLSVQVLLSLPLAQQNMLAFNLIVSDMETTYIMQGSLLLLSQKNLSLGCYRCLNYTHLIRGHNAVRTSFKMSGFDTAHFVTVVLVYNMHLLCTCLR
jgi:hypothetical protein